MALESGYKQLASRLARSSFIAARTEVKLYGWSGPVCCHFISPHYPLSNVNIIGVMYSDYCQF